MTGVKGKVGSIRALAHEDLSFGYSVHSLVIRQVYPALLPRVHTSPSQVEVSPLLLRG